MPEAQTPSPALFRPNEVYFADTDGDHGTKYCFQVVSVHYQHLTIRDSNGTHEVALYTRPQAQAATIHGNLHGNGGQVRLAWADLPASEVFGPEWVSVFLETLA